MLGPGIHHGVEENTNLGRIDLYIETRNFIYICELKRSENPKEAIQQIYRKRYYEKFLGQRKKIILIGINFDENIRNVSNFLFEEFVET